MLAMMYKGVHIISCNTRMYILSHTAYDLEPKTPVYMIIDGDNIQVESYGKAYDHINNALTDTVDIYITDNIPITCNRDIIEELMLQDKYDDYLPSTGTTIVDNLSIHVDKGDGHYTIHGSDAIDMFHTAAN